MRTIFCITMIFLLTACGTATQPAASTTAIPPTATLAPRETPLPSATPLPTEMPLPHETQAPERTYNPDGNIFMTSYNIHGVEITNTMVTLKSLYPSVKEIGFNDQGKEVAENTARIFYKIFVSQAVQNKRTEDAKITFEEFMGRIKDVNDGKRPAADVRCIISASTSEDGLSYKTNEVVVYPFVNVPDADKPNDGIAIPGLTYEVGKKSSNDETELHTNDSGKTYVGVFMYGNEVVIKNTIPISDIKVMMIQEILVRSASTLTNGNEDAAPLRAKQFNEYVIVIK